MLGLLKLDILILYKWGTKEKNYIFVLRSNCSVQRICKKKKKKKKKSNPILDKVWWYAVPSELGTFRWPWMQNYFGWGYAIYLECIKNKKWSPPPQKKTVD